MDFFIVFTITLVVILLALCVKEVLVLFIDACKTVGDIADEDRRK